MTIVALMGLGSSSAFAQEDKQNSNGIPTPSIATSLPNNGDPGDVRKWLAQKGITYQFIYTNDVLGNVSGGLRRGFVDQGKLEIDLQVDLEKLAGWQGLTFYGNAFQIDNTGRIRRDYVGGINTIAAIEAAPSTRLSELWFEKKLWDDKTSLRVGQLAADIEFFYSDMSQIFLQSDWPTIAAQNLPSGGPAYPLATPGIRFKTDPVKDVTLLMAVFNGDPAGPGAGDEQQRNRYGINFRVSDPAFLMAEAQFRANQGETDTGLARTVKIGAWGHLGKFNDQRFADDGTLLADPTGSGVPAQHRGNYGVYGIVDQQIYRPKGGAADSGIGVFARISASPSDRNQIDFYADGGIVFNGMVSGRPNDKFGAGIVYTKFSDTLQAADLDSINFSGVGDVRREEVNLELTYMAQIIPGWTVQPILTRVWHPSGDEPNAIVTGVRSIWRY
jgi:porin